MSEIIKWRCVVCGYVHDGSDAPHICPVCGAGKEDFEKLVEEQPVSVTEKAAAVSGWRCLVCGYVHEGATAPEECPVCGVGGDQFEAIHESVSGDTVHPTDATGRFLIIGAGVAGVSAAETLREKLPQSEIKLISTEHELPYYRLNLTRYLAGEIERDTLPLHPADWYEKQRIDLVCGVNVKGIDPVLKDVLLSDGEKLPYDRLILATGSHPYIPSLPGTDKRGVVTLRTAADADDILDAALNGRSCVCIGGGVLGIETAGALAARGADVTMLESHGWLMPRQLNERAALVLEKHMKGLGVKIVKHARSAAIEGGESVSGVRLADGRFIDAGLVVLATGVRPNTVIARKAGIEVNNGIVVDNHMRTSVPYIYAAGDAAEHNGQLYGAWAASQYQGKIAALNAAGQMVPFGGLPRANTIKALGIDISSFGRISAEDGSYIVVEDELDGSYSCFVLHDNRLVGAILIGFPAIAKAVRAAVEAGLHVAPFESSAALIREGMAKKE